ncbi:MAG TPA: M1 family aminopeptidase, partial [Nitrososphaeraceae archaeon]|nr:M1 family aminopeptidase [Nitrososphaeraceae archaeon]
MQNQLTNNKVPTTQGSLDQVTLNYPPHSYFNIEFMRLSIEPDFNTKRVKCRQQLKISILQDLTKIELDCNKKKIEIHSIKISDAASIEKNSDDLLFTQHDEKLLIDLDREAKEGNNFNLIINYSFNGNTMPSSGEDGMGFNFIIDDKQKAFQCWTQGEPLASNKWFPCIDHPQVKFPRQVSVTVPESFIVISNGEMNIIDYEIEGGKKKYIWEESHPNTAYVTSVVIGQFAQLPKEDYRGRVPLLYYVQPGREDDGIRLFKNTKKMMEFFESFFGTYYPYDKYTQITVDEFPHGGMENTSCTNLTTRRLLDEKILRDSKTLDYVVVHELAHQWFGNLVTCRDWQHLWLNEGFASFSEALYYQHSLGDDDYSHYILTMSDQYLNSKEKGAHTIPLVYKDYENPFDMFSTPRTYKKGGLILHMLRSLMEDDDFRKSLAAYLNSFKFKVAETDDIRKIFEQNSGKSLQEFFDQWIYNGGHPVLRASISTSNSRLNIKIQQTQSNLFRFPLDIVIILKLNDGTEKRITDVLKIESMEIEKQYDVPESASIKRISIDPLYKILKQMKLELNDPESTILLNSLKEGDTLYEKIFAARALTESQNQRIVSQLKDMILIEDSHWGIKSELAKTLGTIKMDSSYNTLKECYELTQNNMVRASIIESIGNFSNPDSFELMKSILEDKDESPNVQGSASVAMAKCGEELVTIPILSSLIDRKSYNEVIAVNAIEGLKIIALRSSKEETIERIIQILTDRTKEGNDDLIRRAATSALGY